MKFRINVEHADWGRRSVVSLLIEKGAMYLMAPYFTLGSSEYFLATNAVVPPSAELPGTVSLTARRHYYCRKSPRLSVKPDGQCHIRTAAGSPLWEMVSSNRIPITKHDNRHIFTIGVNKPCVFADTKPQKKNDTHNVNLVVTEPSSLWENFRIVGFIVKPSGLSGLRYQDANGIRNINGSDLIPAEIGVSKPQPVITQNSSGQETGLFIGVNPGHDWPEPFILHLIFRRWNDFNSDNPGRGGVMIMGSFDAEASLDKPMSMLVISAPHKPSTIELVKSRFTNVFARMRHAWKEATQKA